MDDNADIVYEPIPRGDMRVEIIGYYTNNNITQIPDWLFETGQG